MDRELVLIQSLITVAGILITALLTYYFSKQRYIYEKLYDRKLLYLEEIYGKIISLEKDLNKYLITTSADMGTESLPKKKEELALVLNKFHDLQEFFWKKEIILDESSVSVIQSLIENSIQITSNLKISIISQNINDYKVAFDQQKSAYQVIKDGFSKAKEQLKRDFKTTIKK